jgi:hypothetical protein
LARKKFRATLPWSAAHVAFSLIRQKSQIPNIRHDGTLSIGNLMLMMKKPKNLEFKPLHPKNVLLASVVHGISCLFIFCFIHQNKLLFRTHWMTRLLSKLDIQNFGTYIPKGPFKFQLGMGK